VKIPDSNRLSPKYIAKIPACQSIVAQIYREIQLKNIVILKNIEKAFKNIDDFFALFGHF
jgi:hypothetical protein